MQNSKKGTHQEFVQLSGGSHPASTRFSKPPAGAQRILGSIGEAQMPAEIEVLFVVGFGPS